MDDRCGYSKCKHEEAPRDTGVTADAIKTI
jgi:hypothetical protein